MFGEAESAHPAHARDLTGPTQAQLLEVTRRDWKRERGRQSLGKAGRREPGRQRGLVRI